MLSIFPALITYNLIAPFIIRVVLGLVFLHRGYRRMTTRESGLVLYGVISAILGLFVLIGFLTQISALILSLILVAKLAFKIKRRAFLTDGVNYYLLLLAMAVSLVFSGAGLFAVDLPM